MSKLSQFTPNKKITIDDIANDLGLSKTTVSRAISGKGRIGKETVDRVLAYIEEHDYRPNMIAKSLAQSKTFNIGAIMPADSELAEVPFFQQCLMGITGAATAKDYDVLVTMVNGKDISQLARIINNHKVDGLILTRSMVDDEVVKFLKESGLPFVVTGGAEEGVIQVDHDHQAACKELTEILLSQGIKRPSLIGGNLDHMVSVIRQQGFMDAMKEQKVHQSNQLIKLNMNDKLQVETAVMELIREGTDCIFCLDDFIALQVVYKLRAEKYKIPKDVKVASFYSSTALENYNPSITAIKFDARELGMVACRTLLEMLDGKEVSKKTLLNYEIRIKESTKY